MILEDILICARTVWGEARGEDQEGRLAVAHVMVNRWRTRVGQFAKDDTLATACLRHVQFSVWNEGDPNFQKMQSVDVNDREFRQCLVAVLQALDEPDPTNRSLHYHTRAVSPPWSLHHVPAYETRGHLFFNDIA